MHLYLMLNDQRRHLAAHFENIDLGCVDFHEPFFDADFLAAILHEPIDPFLRHRFYVGWLKKFPSGVLEAPWQAYPGHVPCPVPAPSDLSYQWSESNNEESNRSRRTAIAQVQTIMSNKRFSNEYVQKPYLCGVRLLLQAGLRKREYWLHTVAVLHKYWTKAGNNQQI
jgi:asparagine synthase (glutamine-hydrolysing)